MVLCVVPLKEILTHLCRTLQQFLEWVSSTALLGSQTVMVKSNICQYLNNKTIRREQCITVASENIQNPFPPQSGHLPHCFLQDMWSHPTSPYNLCSCWITGQPNTLGGKYHLTSSAWTHRYTLASVTVMGSMVTFVPLAARHCGIGI